MDVELLGTVRLQALEGEARQVAGAGRDAAERVLGHALHREGGDELRVLVFEAVESHVLDLRIAGARHDLQEVVVLRQAGHRVAGVLERPQLPLGFQSPVDGGVLQVHHLAQGIIVVLEGDEGAHQLGVGPRHRDVMLRGAGRDGRDLGVHRGIAENQAAAAEEHLVEGLHQRGVQGHLAGQHPDVLDAVAVGAGAAGPERVRGLRELDLQHQIQLRREHLARLEEPDEGRGHQNVLVVPVQDRRRVPDVGREEALEGAAVVPLLGLQQAVEPAAAAVLGDVVRALAVAEQLDALDEAAALEGAREDLAPGPVGVSNSESYFDALGVDEVHSAGEGDSRHTAGGRGEGGERRWIILDVAPGLDVIDVRGRELVVQGAHELILDGLGDVLHGVPRECFPS